MQNEDQPIAQFVTSVAGINGLSEPIKVHIIITRTTDAESITIKENSVDSDYESTSTRYIHTLTTSLSESNKQGLNRLSYWRNGFKGSRVYIINQALAQYLAKYQESQRAIPPDEP